MPTKDSIAAAAFSEQEIINRILGGEKDLYALLIRRYNQRLYRIGMSYLNNDADVEEVMQVAYIKAYEHLPMFENKSLFSTWLIRILINECLLQIKKRKMKWVLQESMIHSESQLPTSGHSQTPLMKVLNSELKMVLEQAIQQLPEKYRTVFIMREIEDMSVTETKACLEISEVNVKVRLNRAKVMLRNSLRSYYKKEEIWHFHLSRCNRITEMVMQQLKRF